MIQGSSNLPVAKCCSASLLFQSTNPKLDFFLILSMKSLARMLFLLRWTLSSPPDGSGHRPLDVDHIGIFPDLGLHQAAALPDDEGCGVGLPLLSL